MHIRVDDMVEVTSGKDRKSRSKVLHLDRAAGKVLVEGVNSVLKHMRRSQKNPRGGRLRKDLPISISNVLLVCPTCGQPTRTGVRFRADGSKHRFCKKCSAEIGQLSPANPRYTQSSTAKSNSAKPKSAKS